MMAHYVDFEDEVVAGNLSLAAFARTAGLREIQRVRSAIRYPANRKAWPPEVWAEMEQIRKREVL
jgi:hypothetical protein